jgi:hypothetical protein
MQYFLNEKSIAVSFLYFSLFLLYDEVAFSCKWSGILLSQVKLFMNFLCSRYCCALVLGVEGRAEAEWKFRGEHKDQ